MRILALITALLVVSLPVRALEVLTTIKPLGFIAAAITDGVSEPKVLLPTGASPHDFPCVPPIFAASTAPTWWCGSAPSWKASWPSRWSTIPCSDPDSG